MVPLPEREVDPQRTQGIQRVRREQRHDALQHLEPRDAHLELSGPRSGENVRDEDERHLVVHLRRDPQLPDTGGERGAEDAEREEVA